MPLNLGNISMTERKRPRFVASQSVIIAPGGKRTPVPAYQTAAHPAQCRRKWMLTNRMLRFCACTSGNEMVPCSPN